MAPAPTKTPSQAASNAATARSQRRSVRATSWRRGPPPPVGTGARIAEGAGLEPGALTLAPGGRYRPLVVRFSGCTRTSGRSEEHTSELQSLAYLVCRLLLEKKK